MLSRLGEEGRQRTVTGRGSWIERKTWRGKIGENQREGQNYCCRSAARSCLTLGDPADCSTPVLPVLRHLPELA